MSIAADLSGRRALVTGASSAGFGAHFAKILARSGAEVVVSARRLEPLYTLVAELADSGATAVALPMDVTDGASVKAAINAAGPLDIVVNNAGTSHTAPFLDQTEEQYDKVIDTNLKGTWLVATEAARAMREHRICGSVSNIASIGGVRPINHVGAYAISKAAILHLTRQMGVELARFGIRVNAIAPGYFETDLNRASLGSEAGAALIKRVPMRRLGTYENLDGPLLLLASDASSFMTGSVITVDGGHSVNSLQYASVY
jgi:NAD(P)-dependent dehydrogenase (short-subunit alcohol dehydrogenase family)